MNIQLIASGEADATGTLLAAALRCRWPWASVVEQAAGASGQPDTWVPPDITIILDQHSPPDTIADIVAIRQVLSCPIVIVSLDPPQATEADWLRLGADVVVRAHSMARLLAILETLGREAGGENPPSVEVRTIGDLRLNTSQHVLSIEDSRVTVTPTEFRLIEALAAEFGGCVPSLELMQTLWGLENDALRKSLKVHVSRLRHKLSEAGSTCTVHAIRGCGYSLARREDVDLAKHTPSAESVKSSDSPIGDVASIASGLDRQANPDAHDRCGLLPPPVECEPDDRRGRLVAAEALPGRSAGGQPGHVAWRERNPRKAHSHCIKRVEDAGTE